jgi:hypothetical protein
MEFLDETFLDGERMVVRENKVEEDQPMLKWKETYIRKS